MFNKDETPNPITRAGAFKEISQSLKNNVADPSVKKASFILSSGEKEGFKVVKGNLRIIKSEVNTSKALNDNKPPKITFDSVFNKAMSLNQQIPSPTVPINININNININNYNISNVIRKSNTSNASHTSQKKFSNFQFLPSNSLHLSLNRNSNGADINTINSSAVNPKVSSVESLPLPKINSSNNNDSTLNLPLKKKLISNKISLKVSPKEGQTRPENNLLPHTDRVRINEKDSETKERDLFKDSAGAGNSYKSSRKKLSGTVMGADDLNDSLINDLADFLNVPAEHGDRKEKKEFNGSVNAIKDNNHGNDIEEDNEGNNSLNKAVINDPDDHLIVVKKKSSKRSPRIKQAEDNEFNVDLGEKQVLQPTDQINVLAAVQHLPQEEEEQGPPVNFEHLQQVNERRPQTSYGGISARQKSLQNSLRQMSSKVESKEKKGDLSNPFGMKNKLSQMKHFFN